MGFRWVVDFEHKELFNAFDPSNHIYVVPISARKQRLLTDDCIATPIAACIQLLCSAAQLVRAEIDVLCPDRLR